jgi:hypothetical protein
VPGVEEAQFLEVGQDGPGSAVLEGLVDACCSPAGRPVAMPGRVIWPGVTMSDRLDFDVDGTIGLGQ